MGTSFTNWENAETNFSVNTDPNGQNFGNGITGASGGWVELTADLSAYDGQEVMLGFRYWTDVAAVEPGFMVDDILISGYPLDDAESDAGWAFEGFRLTTGTESAFYTNYYVAEFRQYKGYDKGLANAHNFGWSGDAKYYSYVEHFPYQDGLLVSYWDNSFASNDVGANCASGRCGGLLLPVDAHPELMIRADGGIWRNRVQTYDATFGLERPTSSRCTGMVMHLSTRASRPSRCSTTATATTTAPIRWAASSSPTRVPKSASSRSAPKTASCRWRCARPSKPVARPRPYPVGLPPGF